MFYQKLLLFFVAVAILQPHKLSILYPSLVLLSSVFQVSALQYLDHSKILLNFNSFHLSKTRMNLAHSNIHFEFFLPLIQIPLIVFFLKFSSDKNQKFISQIFGRLKYLFVHLLRYFEHRRGKDISGSSSYSRVRRSKVFMSYNCCTNFIFRAYKLFPTQAAIFSFF